MNFRIEIEENHPQLPHQPWPWNVRLTRQPNGCTTSTFAWSLHEALEKAEKYFKEDL